MEYVPAIVRRCKKGTIRAYPTYYCEKSRLIEELGKHEKEVMEMLEAERDLTGLEKLNCMIPIIPRCLSMINMKTDAGRVEAAEILLSSDNYSRIPDDILLDGKKVRFDPQRFHDYSRYMSKEGKDFIFGEIFGSPAAWAYNCYVKTPVEGIEMERELPVMMLYNNPNVRVGLWFVGEEDGKLLFMYSTSNVPSMVSQINATSGGAVTLHLSGLGRRQRIHRVK